MKKCVLLLTLVTSLFAKENGQTHTITNNPLVIPVGIIVAQYEYSMAPSHSLLFKTVLSNQKQEGIKINSQEFMVGYRKYFLSNRTMTGLYTSILGSYGSATATKPGYTDAEANLTAIYSLTGYKWILNNGITFETGAGLGYADMQVNSKDISVNRSGIVLQIDGNIGFSF